MNNLTIHPLADVQSNKIGNNTRIWQYVVILPEAIVGEGVNICSHCFIENKVLIGDNVTIKSGVQLWDGITIEEGVFIGPNATFTNDIFPRSKKHPENFLKTIIKAGASIGGNATILPGITIAEGAMIGAGAVVTQSVPPNAIVAGNPGRIIGYADANKEEVMQAKLSKNTCKAPFQEQTIVHGVTTHQFPLINDIRGNLSVGEFEQHIPFIPKRYFIVFDVPSKEIRGEHAHHTCHQFLICVRGSCSVLADDGNKRSEIILDSPSKGIYMPPMIWGVQYKYSEDAVLLVFASHHYSASDYIRNYSEFLLEAKRASKKK